MLTRIFYIMTLFFIPEMAASQLPVSNIYHFTINRSASGYSIKKPQFLTQFNKYSYNNQPYFFEDDLVYFTSNYYDKEQTEIASMDLFDHTLTRISYTPESEYSPTPLQDNSGFSCIRVESDGITQSLQIYPKDGMGIPKRYMHNTNNIGYYAWLDGSTLALFLVEDPHHLLAIADAQSERRNIILDNIGRTLKVNKEGKLFFVHKLGDGTWFIKEYDNKTNKLNTVCASLESVEDFEILNDGSFLSAKGSKLYRLEPSSQKGWVLVEDLAKYGINNITRIASRKNHLLLVDSK